MKSRAFAACARALCLAAVIGSAQAAEDVPFITTPDNVTLAMLGLARVGPKDFVIDLGSGDGRIVITAAKRFGARGLGVEIVPQLVAASRENAAKAGVAGRAQFREQDLFRTDLTPATVITMYLLPEVNLQLRPAILALRPGTRVVSHDWDMGDWTPDRTITLDVPDKAVGIEKSSRVHLWTVPARVEGRWCAAARTTLELRQKHQEFSGTLASAGGSRDLRGRIEGATLRTQRPDAGSLTLRLQDFRLLVVNASGAYEALRRATFARRPGATCP